MRPVILQGIKVVEQAHGLFSLVGEHQLEVRESLPRVKLGFFHHYGTFDPIVGHVPHAAAWKDRIARHPKN